VAVSRLGSEKKNFVNDGLRLGT